MNNKAINIIDSTTSKGWVNEGASKSNSPGPESITTEKQLLEMMDKMPNDIVRQSREVHGGAQSLNMEGIANNKQFVQSSQELPSKGTDKLLIKNPSKEVTKKKSSKINAADHGSTQMLVKNDESIQKEMIN